MELNKVGFNVNLVVDGIQVEGQPSQAGAVRQVRDRQVSCRGRFILVMKSLSLRVNLFISEEEVSQ